MEGSQKCALKVSTWLGVLQHVRDALAAREGKPCDAIPKQVAFPAVGHRVSGPALLTIGGKFRGDLVPCTCLVKGRGGLPS